MSENMSDKWVDYAVRIQSIAQAGLAYCEDKYGRERYEASLIEIGAIVALVNYMNQILVELVKFANLIVTMTRAIASGRRIESIFSIKPSMADDPDAVDKGTDTDDAIVFSDVSLTYMEGGEPSLRDISFTIRKGEKIGIIGGTGSGKTSLISLIPRFYDVSSGSVSVFGVDARKWKRSALRSMVAYVPQKTRLFSGTIRSNLQWGRRGADEGALRKALEESDALSFVLDKDGQLDSRVSAGGKNLSGGQRQRLAIAIALIGNPRFLILDEPTNGLDPEGIKEIRDLLLRLNHDRQITVLISSHILSELSKFATRYGIIHQGRLIDEFTEEQLIRRCTGPDGTQVMDLEDYFLKKIQGGISHDTFIKK